jgi:hypothetical protein
MRTGAILVFFTAFLSGCASTVKVSGLKEIQDTQGFYTKSLYYTGSTRHHHYFEQFVLFDLGIFLPGSQSDGYDSYKVPREELILPTDFEFDRKTYEGESDERRRKIRIKDDPAFRVEKRKTAAERLAEKYPDGINLSKARVMQESDGTYVLILATETAANQADKTPAQTTASPSSGL